MPRYRKKPIKVEAVQWFPGADIPGVCLDNPGLGPYVRTAQGRDVPISPGEWVVAESDGSGYYPVATDLFARLYEPDDDIPACPDFGDGALSLWFELSYAQFLTVPRLVMEAMPGGWQARMAAALREMDATFDWRPKDGRYWVRLRDDGGRFSDAPLGDYRRGSVEHLRREMSRDRHQPGQEPA